MTVVQVTRGKNRLVAIGALVATALLVSSMWAVDPPSSPGKSPPGTQAAPAENPAGATKPGSPAVAPKATPTDSTAPVTQPAATGPKPALGGYCPAAYLLQNAAVKGDPAFASKYHGEIYWLSSAEAKTKFEANPEDYLPQFTGLCSTALGGSYGFRVDPNPTVFSIFEQKVYLFSSPRAQKSFDQQPAWFVARATERFVEPGLKGYCPVAYSKRGEALQGRSNIVAAYRGWQYRFVDETFRAAFLDDPQAFLPQYDGYCVEGVSRGKRYPADPAQFFLKDGKTYLLFDAKVKSAFLANPSEIVLKADEQWQTLKDLPKPRH